MLGQQFNCRPNIEAPGENTPEASENQIKKEIHGS
jgi:hypothetical protein